MASSRPLLAGGKYVYLTRNVSRECSRSHRNNAAVAADVRDALVEPRPFSEIPGPSSVPVLKSLLHFLPGGKYFGLSPLKLTKALRQEYGPLVRLETPMKVPNLFIFSTEDTRKVLQADGKYPKRGEFEAYAHHRKSKGLGVGIVAAEGEMWKVYRDMGQRVLGGPQAAMKYVHKNTEAADMFLHHLRRVRDQDCVVHGFEEHAKLWSFESMNMMALGKPVGIYEHDVQAQRLFKASTDAFVAFTALGQNMPLWKYFATKEYKQLQEASDLILDICSQYVKDALESPLPGSMLAIMAPEIRSQHQLDMVIDIFTDLLFSAIDTTSTTLTYLLHCLALHPETQERARQEVLRLLPNPTDPVTPEAVNQMSYLKACLKEALRIHHVAAGVGRNLSQEVVLSGYRVPPGTKCVLVSSFMSLDPENFSDPDTFRPERWLRGSEQYEKPSVWSYLPFGHGPRMCIGRRFAELETWVTCAQLLRHCRIGTTTPHFEPVIKLINVPDRPINLSLTDL